MSERYTFLHVDDENLWIEIVRLLLEEHEVVSCRTISAGKAAFQSGTFDLVICDGSIDADKDGIKWAEELHAAGQNVLILSGGESHPYIQSLQKGEDILRDDTLIQLAKR